MTISTLRTAAAGILRTIAQRLDPPSPPPPPVENPLIEETALEREMRRWFDDRGDQTLRITYPLKSPAVVYDVGGYQGQWASDIYSKYLCRIHVFEPVGSFASSIQERFARNPDIVLHHFGLAGEDRTERIRLANDASSTYDKSEGDAEVVQLRDVGKVLEELGTEYVDVMKINIEGVEYELMERMLCLGLVRKFKNLQIQFHDFVPDAAVRMEAIQRALAETHRITYQYRFVWENWELKP